MKFSKKITLFGLCVSFFFHQILCVSIPAEAGITSRKPQILSSSEENIPVVKSPASEKKGGGKWLWALLGVALIGGVAAAAGGGGGGGGGGDDDDDDGNGGPTTGSIIIEGPSP